MERLELARLADADDIEVEEIDNAVEEEVPEEVEERPAPLAVQRREAILAALRAAGAARCSTSAAARASWWAALLKEPRFTEIVGHGRVGPGARHGGPQAAAGPDGRAAGRAGHPAPGLAGVHRRPAQGLRRGGAQRGGRAPRPAAAARTGVRRVRLGAPAHRGRDDAERRVQRALGVAAGRACPARRPPFRVDPGGVRRLGGGGGGTRTGTTSVFVPVGPDDPEVGPPTQMAVFTRTGDDTDPARAKKEEEAA